MIQKFFSLLFLILWVVDCTQKEEGFSEQDTLLLLLGLSDRAENYDRDVEVISDRIVTTSYGSMVTYDLSMEAELSNYKNLLRVELEKYPRGYWIKAKAERVVLVKNLLVNGQLWSALPDPYQKTLFLSVNAGGLNDEYRIHVIHHELNHNMDFARLGDMKATEQEWTLLNTNGFQYGNGGTSAYANPGIPWSALTNPQPGFVDLYSTLAQEEDRSELVAILLGVPAEYTTLQNICNTDPIVVSKVRQTRINMKRFWPFAVGGDTFWKQRVSDVANICR
ncbi:LIC13305 family lipoprotein [Leptospira yasudae]|uniref:LIC13305 family lipoprotein n=1 Tax=Leptospira yasudae TaxID=2202201 RepID=UPI0010916E5C|nr:hypothetical protein [Leptospira yasudae]TGM97899.1 hypothetical protein EHR10_13480 [Leptospira yasudae]